MPHDKNGTLLQVGDEVILRARVTDINPSETQCNITVEAIERPDGEGYFPTAGGNSRFYEKAQAGSPDDPNATWIAPSGSLAALPEGFDA